ncbi:ATP-grasp fold amidoligase family protein [Rhodohalobacter sp. 8-1]|uniref:ATP-grasp fold amidoligase family protein n=1 Tax=Rhodohalobacter sp. 8-1 TaxID=3131972 RepID=UPI0030ECE20A
MKERDFKNRNFEKSRVIQSPLLKHYLLSKLPLISYNYLLIREFLRGFENIRDNFFRVHGNRMDLKNPSSFSKKVHWRKIFDTDPLLVQFSDKVQNRDNVRQRLGDQESDKILLPMLHISDDPNDIPFKNLPDTYIIKPNHMNGKRVIVDTNPSFS